MTIQALQRVLWRLRTKQPNNTTIHNTDLRRAIMQECGTHELTYQSNRRALLKLGWIKTMTGHYVKLTNKDQTEQ